MRADPCSRFEYLVLHRAQKVLDRMERTKEENDREQTEDALTGKSRDRQGPRMPTRFPTRIERCAAADSHITIQATER